MNHSLKAREDIENCNITFSSSLKLSYFQFLPEGTSNYQNGHYIDEVEKLADHVRSVWSLGCNAIPDLINMFEEHGIKVFEINHEHYPKLDGLYAMVNGQPIIVVSDHRPADRQRFTLAHELGHILLDNRLAIEADIEDFCNRFAGAFLLPKQAIKNNLGEHRHFIESRELNLLKQEFGISMTGILHRAEDTGIISNSLYRQLRAEFNVRGWSK